MSPVLKRWQGLNQAVELQSPLKTSKQESHMDEKIGLASEPEIKDSLLVTARWQLETRWAKT